MSELVEFIILAKSEAIKGRDSDVFDLRYGIAESEPLILQQIANIYGLSRERIRQLLNRSLKKLKSRGLQQIRKEEFDKPCAQLVGYIDQIVDYESEQYFNQLYHVIETELSFMRAYTAIQFIHYFAWKDSKTQKAKLKQAYSEYNKYQQKKKLEERNKFRFNKLMNYVIWSENVGNWSPEKFKDSKPQRKIENDDQSGQFWSAKLQRTVGYESQLEYSFLGILEQAPQITYYLEQPFSIEYELDEKTYPYYPDIFLLLDDGRGIVVEIKSTFQMGQYTNLAKWKAMKEYCMNKGMGFLVTDGITCIQDVTRYSFRIEIEELLLETLATQSLNWEQYAEIRDRYKIKFNEFVAIILKNRLDWRLAPFRLTLDYNK